jgi:hypothetical protein
MTVAFSFAAPSAGTLRATATTEIADGSAAAARPVTVLAGKRSFAAAGKRKLRLELTRPGRRALARATRATLKLKLAFTDAAATQFTKRKTVIVKR